MTADILIELATLGLTGLGLLAAEGARHSGSLLSNPAIMQQPWTNSEEAQYVVPTYGGATITCGDAGEQARKGAGSTVGYKATWTFKTNCSALLL